MNQEGVEFLGIASTFSPDLVNLGGDANSGDCMQMLWVVGVWDDLIVPALVNQQGDGDSDITVNHVSNMPPTAAGVTYATFAFPLTPNDADVYRLNHGIMQGTSTREAAVHEFGHALSLMHLGSCDASNGTVTYANDRDFDEDIGLFSVMSYFNPNDWNPLITWTQAAILTPMIYDILAIQSIYCADMITRTRDTTYGFNNDSGMSVFSFNTATPSVFTIWDAGGWL